jgi:hypothetical protein
VSIPDQDEHAGRRGEHERVELAVRGLAHGHPAPREQHRARARGAEDEHQHDGQLVEAQRAGDEVRALAELPDPEADRRQERAEREQRDDDLARDPRAQEPEHEHQGGADEQRQQRRQPGPVERGRADLGEHGAHGVTSACWP